MTKMVIAHELLFSIIEHPIFQSFIALLKPKFKLLSFGTLKTNITSMYDSMKASLANEISKMDQIALTTNLWMLPNQSPFMVISGY